MYSQEMLFENFSPDTVEDEQVGARRELDELFTLARKYNSSQEYFRLLQFIARFRFYSAFNAMLIHTQMPGAKFVATPQRWLREYGRCIKAGASPLVILKPKGPVMFVFDVIDTDPLPGVERLPHEVEDPFSVRRGVVRNELAKTIENAKRDGVLVADQNSGSQMAGKIQVAGLSGLRQRRLTQSGRQSSESFPLRYELLLNENHSTEVKYATLVHELAHLYCGHLGTPNAKWWPNRQALSLEEREFEAESVSYLVCKRLGIETPSEEYLAGYLKGNDKTPSISLDCVVKSVALIERMGKETLKSREKERV